MMRGLADVCFRKEAERAVWPMSVPGEKLSVRPDPYLIPAEE